MPVTSNEPTTLLQRLPEDLEYTNLLDIASTTPNSHQKMLNLAIFAQSFLSTLRSPKRALRKSFTPLLSETYELIREDKGYRFLSEKVQHRPQIFAAHAESDKWTWSFCPSPRQKFWGKSFEMTIEGTVKVVLLNTGEVITWQKPACYMRNIIAGEKYIEPVGEIIVWNHSSGEKAVVEFKPAKGLWSGRAEEVGITTYTKDGGVGVRAEGKWNERIKSVPGGEELWEVGDLVENEDRYCGFPVFTAQLSETTVVEDGFLSPTDSRLRPDRKLHELGKMAEAEEVKIRLEEEQRVRRREGKEPPVKWFEKVTMETEGLGLHKVPSQLSGGNPGIGSDTEDGGEEQIWRMKEGKDGYWSRRETGNWDGVIKLW
jgi:oxysterol-binding protein-related protein 3/6/7